MCQDRGAEATADEVGSTGRFHGQENIIPLPAPPQLMPLEERDVLIGDIGDTKDLKCT